MFTAKEVAVGLTSKVFKGIERYEIGKTENSHLNEEGVRRKQ